MAYQLGSAKVWSGTEWVDAVGSAPPSIDGELLVLAGGAGGGRGSANRPSGGGGAGGFFKDSSYSFTPGTYSILVGAGGAGANSDYIVGGNGNTSQLGFLFMYGGGGGAASSPVGSVGSSGGSAGGTAWDDNLIHPAQTPLDSRFGNSGGTSNSTSAGVTDRNAGGGGGAGSSGANGSNSSGGNGGAGISDSITGSALFYAGGGGAGSGYDSGGSGGSSIGGDGTSSGGSGASASPANRGSGGGGGSGGNGGSGSSGVVIFAVPTGTTVSFSVGVSQTSATVGTNDVYTVTAAGISDTVTIGDV